MKRIILSLLISLAPYASIAQELEEIVVTASRGSVDSLPGVVLTKTGDYLLLKVLLTNDTRDERAREQEIYKTLKNAITAAQKISGIELSLVEEDFVVPLNIDNYRVDLESGRRPDSAEATIRVKTAIPKQQKEATALVEKMKGFVKSVPVEGRTELTAVGSVAVSVVSPNSYRTDILKLVAEDIKTVTASLGEDYRVVLEGADRPVRWVRNGSLQLTLYIPYQYLVVPINISSIIMAPDY